MMRCFSAFSSAIPNHPILLLITELEFARRTSASSLSSQSQFDSHPEDTTFLCSFGGVL